VRRRVASSNGKWDTPAADQAAVPAGKETADGSLALGRDRYRISSIGNGHGNVYGERPATVAPRQVTPGALRDRYEIPRVTCNRKTARGLLLSSLFVISWVAWHLGWQSLVLACCAAPAIVFRAVNWILSWFDHPAEVLSPDQDKYLARLYVTVAVPVYNEDPGLLDRCLYALVNQSRPPQLVWVVDDGSKTDYTPLRQYWTRAWPGGTQVRWTRQHNQGKRPAHALVFAAVPEADIFVTVDSDTTLEWHALEEGLKPFQRSDVMSVAGIEMGFNATVNFLTRLQCSLQLYAQAVIGAAWSAAGDMYTNRGPFALYRAAAVLDFLPIYRDETFFGRHVVLGDDSLLTLFASSRGRSVQQLTAFGLTMWPENFSHHLRQRIRWARGRTMRNFWRIKYRPLHSYCWWWTVTGIYGFLFSFCLPVLIILWWPVSAHFAIRALIAIGILSIPNSLRALCFRRSDETRWDRALLFLMRPLAALWSSVVLARGVRMWGTLTVLRQGWTTRQHGAELVLDPVAGSEAVPDGAALADETVPSGELA
jgi:hyaluronan synthase